MPHVSGNKGYDSGNGNNNSSDYNPREEGFDDDQAAEIEAFESGGYRRIRDELRK